MVLTYAGSRAEPWDFAVAFKKAEAGFASAFSTCAAGELASFDTLLDSTGEKCSGRKKGIDGAVSHEAH